jgi:hypothetical protein
MIVGVFLAGAAAAVVGAFLLVRWLFGDQVLEGPNR